MLYVYGLVEIEESHYQVCKYLLFLILKVPFHSYSFLLLRPNMP